MTFYLTHFFSWVCFGDYFCMIALENNSFSVYQSATKMDFVYLINVTSLLMSSTDQFFANGRQHSYSISHKARSSVDGIMILVFASFTTNVFLFLLT